MVDKVIVNDIYEIRGDLCDWLMLKWSYDVICGSSGSHDPVKWPQSSE